jgi:hypothetical protein
MVSEFQETINLLADVILRQTTMRVISFWRPHGSPVTADGFHFVTGQPFQDGLTRSLSYILFRNASFDLHPKLTNCDGNDQYSPNTRLITGYY